MILGTFKRGFDTYMFSVEVRRFRCVECGYTSVTADIINPYDPVKIPGEGKGRKGKR